MSNFVSQTQDEQIHIPYESIDIDLLNRDQLRQLDPSKTLFGNDAMCFTSFYDMSLIAREMVVKSSYVDDMRGKVAREGVISPSFAAFFVDEMLLELEEWDYESDSERETVDYGYKLGTNSQYTCACGVILYMLLCGPPKNDSDQRFINFYNQVGLGVHVNPSSWFGSVHKRKTWCHLDEFSHKCILKMVHIDCYNYNGVYSSSGEARSDVFFGTGHPVSYYIKN